MKYDFDKVIDRKNNNAAKFLEAELTFGTNDLMPLWMADMDFSTAPEIIEAIKQRADQGIFGYTNRPKEYFEACQGWLKRRHSWDVSTDLMAFAQGVIPSMIGIIHQFTKEGDKILIQPPIYPPFRNTVLQAGRVIVENPIVLDENGKYQIDFQDFEDKVKSGVKLFSLCSPHNPMGRCWSRQDLEKMVSICHKYGVLIISDEIHADLVLFGNKHIPTASVSKEAAEITITLTAASKSFNLAGLQSSTIIFPKVEWKDAHIVELKKNDVARNNCFSLVATMAAYNEGFEWMNQLITYIENNMKFVKEYLEKEIPQIKTYLPEATYLMWLDCTELGMNGEELQKFLVYKAKLGLNAGKSFSEQTERFARLNTACPRATLEKALKQLKDAVNSL